jgi:Domain of unknown function (DUF4387)
MRKTSNVRLRDLARVIRSKNSGPYELTLDVIFPTEAVYRRIRDARVFTPDSVAALYRIPVDRVLKVVHYDPALAVKATIVRSLVSGAIGETDVYGAQQHAPLLDMEIPEGAAGPATSG